MEHAGFGSEQQRAGEDLRAIVVGGSGMLHGTCLALAAAGWGVGVVWRAERRLAQLVADGRDLPGDIVPIPCDYEDAARLADCLGDHVASVPAVRLVVSWIPGSAERALRATVEAVDRVPAPRRTLLEVHASAVDQPGHVPARLDLGPHWTRRRATLGFRMEQDGHMRWLTDREVALGVTDAIRSADPEAVIGSLHPWSLKA